MASGLWFRVGFVWLVTLACALSYLLLVADSHFLRLFRGPPAAAIPWYHHAYFLLMVVVSGAIVAYQVERIRVLWRSVWPRR
jgi:hypothetical protein